MSYNDTVPADHDVVRDLNEIIDSRPFADDRIPQGASINGRVGADLNIVFTAQAIGWIEPCG